MSYELLFKILVTDKITIEVQKKLMDDGFEWITGNNKPIKYQKFSDKIKDDTEYYICVTVDKKIFWRYKDDKAHDIKNWDSCVVLKNYFQRKIVL